MDNKKMMLINEDTGEIAYHCLILKEKGGLEFKQKPLNNNKGRIKFISPEYFKKNNAKINRKKI